MFLQLISILDCASVSNSHFTTCFLFSCIFDVLLQQILVIFNFKYLWQLTLEHFRNTFNLSLKNSFVLQSDQKCSYGGSFLFSIPNMETKQIPYQQKFMLSHPYTIRHVWNMFIIWNILSGFFPLLGSLNVVTMSIKIKTWSLNQCSQLLNLLILHQQMAAERFI